MPEVYRADHVGSLLRPADIHRARAAYREGTLEQHQLRVIEDAAILHALERQQAAGVDIYTDGEFRRSGFQNDLIEAVEGYVETDDPVVVRVWQGPGGAPTEQGTRQVVGARLRQLRRLTQYPGTIHAIVRPGPRQDNRAEPQPVSGHQLPDGPDRPILPHPLGPAVGHRRDHQSGDCGVA